jgi:hypothetical protein
MFDRVLSLTDITPAKPEEGEADEQQDAPAESDAEATEPHLTDARREDKPPTRRPIYGTRRKEQPSWLLGPPKSTKRTSLS